MLSVDIAMEEIDSDSLGALFAQFCGDGAQRFFVEILDHLAFIGRSLADGMSVAPGYKRWSRVPIGIVKRWARGAGSVQYIGKARGGDQCGACAGAHYDGVGGDGGTDLD